MDIVDFFKKVVVNYNDQNKCGFCWAYGAPLSESAMNRQEILQEDACCMQVFLTDVSYRSEFRFSPRTQLPNYEACNISFTLFVGRQVEDIGLNSYSEIPGHPVTEGLWDTIWRPLQDCFGCGRELDLCELGYNFDITKWDMSMIKFKDDKNFTGWKILGTFRITNIQ